MVNSQFRSDFPEFADAARYPDAMLTMWAGIGEKVTSADRFGDLFSHAVELFVAHNIVLASGNVEASATGGSPGGKTGSIQQKKVGSVSVTYNNEASMLPGAGHWNLTTYGKQYIQLSRLIGAGCVQL